MTPATSLLFVFYFLLFSSLYFPYFFLSSPDFVSLFLLLSLLLHLLFYSSFPSSSLTLLLHTFCVVVNIVNFLRRMVGPPVFNSIKLRLMKSINNSEICRFLSYVIISFLFLDRMSYIECLKSCSSQCGLLWTVTTGEDLWLTTWSLTLWQLRCVNKNKKEVNEWTNFPKLESRTRGWWEILSPTYFPYRRTESIVSLERGVYSCAELQVFSCYRGWQEECQATRTISVTSRRELSSSFFPLQGKALQANSRHSDRNVRGACTIVCHSQNSVAPFKRGDFSTCDAPRFGRPKTVTTPKILTKFTS